MKSSDANLGEKLRSLDKRLAHAARGIGVLRSLNWSPEIGEQFLKSWRSGSPQIPQITYPQIALPDQKIALRKVAKECAGDHPVLQWLADSANSYVTSIEMMEGIGKSPFTEHSKLLYGSPQEQVHEGSPTHLAAAEHFIHISQEFRDSCAIPESAVCITPLSIRNELAASWKEYFPEIPLEFELEDSLLSKAAAGAKRVRVRTSTCFSEADGKQLFEHECLVHSLTAINGKAQPLLPSMGLGAPRTTRTQEGLALFAELITGAMDLSRLRRIALRVKAVQMGLEGADFLELFRFFLENGQNEHEAFHSAARIFRGGSPDGKVVFTKDCVYLSGLTEVHTFLRKSIQAKKLEYPHYLFSGRVSLGDITRLEPCFEDGIITVPRHVPKWIENRSGLSAFLLYSVFLNSIELGKIELEDFV